MRTFTFEFDDPESSCRSYSIVAKTPSLALIEAIETLPWTMRNSEWRMYSGHRLLMATGEPTGEQPDEPLEVGHAHK